MTPKPLGSPSLIQIYNIEPLLAWAIKTTKVNTVHWVLFCLSLLKNGDEILFWHIILINKKIPSHKSVNLHLHLVLLAQLMIFDI